MAAEKKGSKGRDTRSIKQTKSEDESCWQEEKGKRGTANKVRCNVVMVLTRLMGDTDGSDQKRTKANFPSGLVSNWQSKISPLSQASKVTAPGSNGANTMTQSSGLNNEDAFGTFSPEPLITVGTQAAPNHKNDVGCFHRNVFPLRKGTNIKQFVLIHSGDEDDSDVIPVKTSNLRPKPKSKPKSGEQKLATSAVEPRSAKVPKPDSSSAEITSAPASSNIINTLPEFARSTWGTTFLPTLYDRLGRSPDPFVIDVDMVKVIQEVVDLAYPDSDYQVRLGDRIFAQVSLYLTTFQSN